MLFLNSFFDIPRQRFKDCLRDLDLESPLQSPGPDRFLKALRIAAYIRSASVGSALCVHDDFALGRPDYSDEFVLIPDFPASQTCPLRLLLRSCLLSLTH